MTSVQRVFDEHLARGDHRAATEWLVRAHGHDVMRLCVSLVRDPRTAEDLAQDAFGKAFTALGGFRGDASAKTWLMTIARHRCLDHLRRRARQPWMLGREEDLRDAPPIDEVPLVSELLARRADLGLALAALGEAERALVVLRFAHGMSYDELARSFGIKAGTARMRVARALDKMRGAIGELHAGAPGDARATGAPVPVVAPAAAPRGGGVPGGFGGARRRSASAPSPAAPPSESKGGLLQRLRGAFRKPAAAPAQTPADAPPPAPLPRDGATGAPSAPGRSEAPAAYSSSTWPGEGATGGFSAPKPAAPAQHRAPESDELARRFGAALDEGVRTWMDREDEQTLSRLLQRVRSAFTAG